MHCLVFILFDYYRIHSFVDFYYIRVLDILGFWATNQIQSMEFDNPN